LHYNSFMASRPDQQQPDPEWQEDEQLPDEPSAGDNRLRRALRIGAHAGAVLGDTAIEILSSLIP
jgi:hypothetical protein